MTPFASRHAENPSCPDGATPHPHPSLLCWSDFDWYVRHLCLPWQRTERGVRFAAAAPNTARRALARRYPRAEIEVFPLAKAPLIAALNHVFRSRLIARASGALARSRPELCARTGLSRGQKLSLAGGGLGLGLLVAVSPSGAFATLAVLFTLLFTALSLFRLLLLCHCLDRAGAENERAAAHAADRLISRCHTAADTASLPLYTILVPLLHEADMLPGLIAALDRLDYPQSRLDIKLILEEDDQETRAALRALSLPPCYDVIVVPASDPKTKPKACNYALHFAQGAFTVIYDAEDRPCPDQLRKAVAMFAHCPQDVVCLQASLGYYNASQNWLTRQFAIEYAVWFRLVLPALHKLALPIPLGGTSNHFRTDALKEMGGWDPYNVTEDADLGMRLARLGYRCAILDSITEEEANSRLGNWLRQRSRWLKGFLQTWLVHMRRPCELYRALGPGGFVGFHAVIGGTLATSLAPLIVIAFTLGHELPALWGARPVPLRSYQSAGFSLAALGFSVAALAAMIGLKRARLGHLWRSLAGMPFYWGLTSAALCKALWQFARAPHYWEKTVHGLDGKPPSAAAAREGTEPKAFNAPFRASRSGWANHTRSPAAHSQNNATCVRPPPAPRQPSRNAGTDCPPAPR